MELTNELVRKITDAAHRHGRLSAYVFLPEPFRMEAVKRLAAHRIDLESISWDATDDLRDYEQLLDEVESLLYDLFTMVAAWRNANAQRLNSRQLKTLFKMLTNFESPPSLTILEYARLNNVSADTARRDLKDLIEIGILHDGPGSRFFKIRF